MEPGAVLDQLADRHLPGDIGVGVVGPVLRQRRIEIEHALKGELADGRRGEDLVDGTEVEGGLDGVGPARLAVGHAAGTLVHRPTGLHEYDHARELIGAGQAVEGAVEP
jgi:hypothetical protein